MAEVGRRVSEVQRSPTMPLTKMGTMKPLGLSRPACRVWPWTRLTFGYHTSSTLWVCEKSSNVVQTDSIPVSGSDVTLTDPSSDFVLWISRAINASLYE